MEFEPKIKIRGREFVLVPKDELIIEGAVHTTDGMVFNPLMNPDTVGQTPADFSPNRAFYNPVEVKRMAPKPFVSWTVPEAKE